MVKKADLYQIGKDNIYQAKQSQVDPFEFNQDVAFVFDDMISRSVPHYDQVQKLCALLCREIYRPNMTVLDLGCSTGTSLIEINKILKDLPIDFIAVDNSEFMLKICQQKLQAYNLLNCVTLVKSNLEDYVISNTNVVLLNYTLQFVAPDHRLGILKRIHSGLTSPGYLILSEKVNHKDQHLGDLLTDLHLDFKRAKGYSELEIAQKRDALENRLIPLNLEDNIKLLYQAGFQAVELVYKAFNFTTLLARK